MSASNLDRMTEIGDYDHHLETPDNAMTFSGVAEYLLDFVDLKEERRSAVQAAERYGLLDENCLNMSPSEYDSLFDDVMLNREDFLILREKLRSGEKWVPLFLPPINTDSAWDKLIGTAIPQNKCRVGKHVDFSKVRKINPNDIPGLDDFPKAGLGSRIEKEAEKLAAFAVAYSLAPIPEEPKAKILFTTDDIDQTALPNCPTGNFCALECAQEAKRTGVKFLDPLGYLMLLRRRIDQKFVMKVNESHPLGECTRTRYEEMFAKVFEYEFFARMFQSGVFTDQNLMDGDLYTQSPFHVLPNGRIVYFHVLNDQVVVATAHPSSYAPHFRRRKALG